jgi:hypothetical protein
MHAHDVILLQADLIDRLADARFQRLVEGHLQSVYTMPSEDHNPHRQFTGVGRTVRNGLRMAKAYYIEPEMFALVRQRGEHQMVSQSTVNQYVEPQNYGFAVLGEPWKWTEARGRMESCHVIAWCPMRWGTTMRDGTVKYHSGMCTTLWLDTQRGTDDIYDELIREGNFDRQQMFNLMGRWNLTDIAIHDQLDIIGGAEIPIGPQHRAQILKDGHTPMDSVINQRRIYCNLWYTLEQVLPGVHKETHDEPDRRTRKAAKRMSIPTQVEMVTLRRETTPVQNPGTGSPISVQYHVDPFKRTLNRGTPEERVIWVTGHDRGPKDAPFSMRQRVHHLKR